jgi:hypothetical protein
MQASRLPRLLLRLTDLAMGLLLVAAVLSVVVAVVAGASGTDAQLKVPVEFSPDQSTYELSSASWGNGVIESARGLALFENPGPGLFVGSAAAGIVIFMVPAFMVLLFLRRIFGTMAAGKPFVDENIRRIRWIGWLMIIFGFLNQAVRWGLIWYVHHNVVATGLDLSLQIDQSLVQPDMTMIFLGLVVLALAEVFRYGAGLQADSDLTV